MIQLDELNSWKSLIWIVFFAVDSEHPSFSAIPILFIPGVSVIILIILSSLSSGLYFIGSFKMNLPRVRYNKTQPTFGSIDYTFSPVGINEKSNRNDC